MLVLSRKSGKSIVIDRGITVTLIAVKGNVVQIGIEAPKVIPVRRSELCERSQESEKQLAASKEMS